MLSAPLRIHSYRGIKLSFEGKLRRGKAYYDKLVRNKSLARDKGLTLPKQVGERHPDVLFYLEHKAKEDAAKAAEKPAKPAPKAKPKPKGEK